MKIECILKRKGGTEITLGATKYHFTPDELDRHVAEVSDETHINRLLSITEAYRPMNAEDAPQAPADPASGNTLNPQETLLKGSTVHPETINLGDGNGLHIDDVVDAAFAESGLTQEQWNELSDEDRHANIDAYLDTLAGDEEGEGEEEGEKPTDEETDEEKLDRLRAEYKAAFGKQAHGQMKAETIEQKLAEGKA